jgi:vancomycin resistance protein YoaR
MPLVRRSHLMIWFGFMIVAAGAGVISFFAGQAHIHRTGIWTVAGVDIDPMSPDSRQKLEAAAGYWQENVLVVQAFRPDGGVLQARVRYVELGASWDVEKTLQRVQAMARRYPVWWRIVLASTGHRVPQNIAPVIGFDENILQRWLNRWRSQVEVAPQDARLRYLSPSRWEIVPEKTGYRLPANTEILLQDAVHRGQTVCTLAMENVSPRITSAHLGEIDAEWTVVTTRYSERERNRAHNIRKAASSINGIILLPGDTFSYNEVVGPRTFREGFRKAPVIVKGELVPGDGGGVCQVSTTVYMAALQAGLQIVQRSHHAFPIHYAPPGLDATVVYGAIDLRFRNNTPCPIALVAEAKNGRVVVRVLGAERYRRAVKLQRVVHAVIPAPVKTFATTSLPAGVRKIKDKGHRGWRVSVYRIIEEPGKPPVREKVTTDYYRPQPRIVLVGQATSTRSPAQETMPAEPHEVREQSP